MANSKLILTFSGDPINNEVISFSRYLLSDQSTNGQLLETFLNTGRTANFTIPTVVTTNPPYPIAGSASAYVYQKYFRIDDAYNLFTVTYIAANIVWIEFTNDLWAFDNLVLPSTVTAVIENISAPTYYLIGNAIYSEATKECSNVNVTLETSELSTKIWINDVLTNDTNIDNPVTFPFIRGLNNVIKLENATGDIIEYPDIENVYFDFLSSENITISVVPYLTGATLTISAVHIVGLELEYSLDNVNWQISNVFTGQESGTKYLYIRDQFGCVKSKEYTVNEFGTREPYLYLSKANSINYSEVIDVDGCTIFKNDTNTLAYNSLVKYPYCEELLFQTCDNTKTQFKSNYTNISAVLRKEDSADVNITVNKMTSNLNRFKSMDAIYYKYNEGKLGLRFESGNTYDKYGVVIEQYALNGNLPEFAIIGQYVTINNIGVLQVTDVVFDEDRKKRAIIFDYFYKGDDVIEVVSSIYDLLQFEVYEFSIDWSVYGVGYYDVVITNQDDDNGTVIHNSEIISILDVHEDTVAIRYYNTNNRDIFYKFGIQHFIRIPLIHIVGVPKDENEINISDKTSNVVDSDVYELDEFKFDTVSKEVMRKLVIALSCDFVFANGIGYIKNGSISSENIEMTNLYDIIANMLKTGINYNNNRGGETGISIDGTIDGSKSTNDIPLIITDGTNFIKQ